MPSKPTSNERLAKRTIQIIGWLSAFGLTIYKLYEPTADVPWAVVFGFVGVGISAEIDLVEMFGRRK